MSKIMGHKYQLALAVLKSRRVELDSLLDLKWYDRGLYKEIERRIASIDEQIKDINERIAKK
jgi:hypothetical protein